ncbi:MAG: SMP-30/gluconolactonase/LRE family protein [Dermatophilaceae bacterium]
MTGDVPADVFLDLRAEHAEGPIWDALSARLWWVDITGQAVHCSDPSVGSDTAWRTPWQPGGVVLDALGRPVVAAPDGLVDLDTDTGATELRIAIELDKPENRANDVAIDSRGRCWLGTMAYDKRPGNAALYLVDSGVVSRVVDGLTISNGPAFDEAGGRMYLADTALSRVDVFDFDPASGALTGRRPFVDLTSDGFWPDGMTVDAEGMLWVACGRAGAVHRYRPDGILDGVVGIPTSNPTSVAFGGTDGADLYITTSWFDLEPPLRAAQPLAGAIFTCRPGVTGQPSSRYVGVPADPAPIEEGSAP